MSSSPSVSVIVPTFGRPDYHEHLYKVFASQTYPLKDLWVLDDSPAPSMFFARVCDPRVHYQWTPTRMSIGAKRNSLIAESTGQILVHQDDDDHYAPTYVATMIGRLQDDGVELTKLSVWDAQSAYDRSIWRWDTRNVGPTHFAVSGSSPALRLPSSSAMDMGDNALWGYGFSYVFTRSAWYMSPFPDMNLGEDMAFVERLRQLARVSHQADLPHLVLHTIHSRSTSHIYPQECRAWCIPCGDAPASMLADYGTAQQVAGQTVPMKITLVPGRTYQVLAMLKTSHDMGSLSARVAGYQLKVLGLEDNIPAPPGFPPPEAGYRYLSARVRARGAQTVRTGIPFPFSVRDHSRVVALSIT